jgi:hypothetical protein
MKGLNKKIIVGGMLVLGILFDSGCATMRVRSQAAQGATTEAGAIVRPLHRWFWGQVWHGELEIDSCTSGGFQTVEVSANFGQTVATIASLGIYCPVTVSVICSGVKPPRPPRH